jgi:thiamine biosynthesis lipoprotein
MKTIRSRGKLPVREMAAVALLCLSCARPLRHEKHQFFRMDMPVTVTIVTDQPGRALGSLWKSADSLLRDWEVRYSQSNPRSEVRAINQRAVPCVAVDARLGTMIAAALAYGDTTGGMFDCTILPVKELWGLGETDTGTTHAVPSDSALAAAVERVNYRRIMVNAARDTLCFTSRATQVDAGGIAKGFALMELGSLLVHHGIHDFLINASDIIARGHRKDGLAWRIGIQDPRYPEKQLFAVPLDSGAIFTSGDYERFWIAPDGRRIHHIFNPKTGFSCTGNQSVTLWSMDPLQAKFLSTGLYCLPADSILAFAAHRGLECCVVDSTGKPHITAGWRTRGIPVPAL